MSKQPILKMQNIEKEYFGNKVLKGINLTVHEGEIHALLGENGAGKSTLMNILFGMSNIHSTGGFSGKIQFEGRDVQVVSPSYAMHLGIGMVHQEFMLIPGFTVAENIKLNRELVKDNSLNRLGGKGLAVLDREKMQQDARKALDTLGVDIDEMVTVSSLPVGHMQFIEIAREVDKKNIKLLVFDEPTAVLSESEASTLLQIMKKLASKGIAIIFITHRLEEVIEIADEVTILRDGEWVKSLHKKDVDVMQLAELMVGRKIEKLVERTDKENIEDRETVLAIKNLSVNMPGEKVKNVSLDVKKGEIMGIGGLAGQGKIGIANGVLGIYPRKGEIVFKGEAISQATTKDILKKGIAFVSENRRGNGLLLDSSIEENMTISAMYIKNDFNKKILFFSQKDGKSIRTYAQKMIKELDIRCVGPLQATRRLSGGNQQKVCVARALTLNPELLFVSEPTRGIDIGAKKLLLEYLYRINKEKGVTIIMTSSELAELRSICDRIAIVANGKIEGILKPTDSDADYGLMMSGDYKKFKKNKVVNL